MPVLDDLTNLRAKPFRDAITKLEDLVTQGGPAFLIGAGCSKCAGLPLMEELTARTLLSTCLDATTKKILEGLQTLFVGASGANIEDYLSELVDLLAIADRRGIRGATENKVDLNGDSYGSGQLRDATEQIKLAIFEIINAQVDIEVHREFVKAVHKPLRPGKSNAEYCVDYLVLNYDTLLEDVLALERIPVADGLEGGVTGWWSPLTFRREGLCARVLKIHGSINWCEFPGDPLPRRVSTKMNLPAAEDRRVLIWPASTKYRETQRDPYAQLAELARQTLRPKIGSQKILLVAGYRFGDSHINFEIDQALRESSGRLTLVIFTSDNEPTGQIKLWNEDEAIRDQVLIFANRGFYHGDKVDTSASDLLWWKFENITRLLGGER